MLDSRGLPAEAGSHAVVVMDDLVLVGRVARAHGNKGQVIVNSDTDFPDQRFRPGEVLLVGPELTARRIREARFQKGRPIIALDGIETMNDAEALAGAELKVAAAPAGSLPEGTFFHYDLIGCDVVDTAGQPIGAVTAVEGTMEMSRLVVSRGARRSADSAGGGDLHGDRRRAPADRRGPAGGPARSQ